MVKNTQRGDHSLHHSCQCQLWEIAGIPPGCAAILGYSGFPPSVVWYFCFEVSGPGLPGRWRCDVRCHETSVPNNESRVNTQKIDDFKVKDELTVLEFSVDCPVYGLSVHDRRLLMSNDSGVPMARGGGWGGSTLPPEIPKALQNRGKLNPIVKTVKNWWI